MTQANKDKDQYQRKNEPYHIRVPDWLDNRIRLEAEETGSPNTRIIVQALIDKFGTKTKNKPKV